MATNNSELACVYAALILADDDVSITGEKLQTILKAANVEVEPYWPGLFAKALEGINVKDLICNLSSGVGAAGPAVGGVGGGDIGSNPAPVPDKEEEVKKKEESEEDDDDMGFGLFD